MAVADLNVAFPAEWIYRAGTTDYAFIALSRFRKSKIRDTKYFSG